MSPKSWLTLALLAITLGGCTPTGESSNQKAFTYSAPTPPSWLHGIWQGQSPDRKETFTISAKDIVHESLGTFIIDGIGIASSTRHAYAGFHKTFRERSTEAFYEIAEVPEHQASVATASFTLLATDSVTYTHEFQGASGLATQSITLTRQS